MVILISEKRHDLILQELIKKDFLTLQELMDRTGCSASTIRRDLSKLQLAGKLQRIHGGATLNHNRMVEPRLTEKLTQNSREKKEIAKRAARQIRDNECVFLDAGSTTLEMIPYIDAKDIIVVTNGLTHVEQLLKKGIKTLMLGGQVKENTFATVGSSALETLKRYCFDKSFIGTTPDEQEALIKDNAMRLSNESFVVVDETKFNQVYFARVPVQDNTRIITSKQGLQHVNEAFAGQYEFLGGTI